jgi:hypothetical protein
MKKNIPFLAIILGVILVVIAVVIPSGSGETGFTHLTKMLPEDVGEFTYFDIGTLQSDEELQSVWSSVKDYFLGEDIYGENVSKITGFGIAGSQYNLMLYTGDFDIEEMTSEIEKSSLESFDFDGITIWTDQYSYSTAVVDDVVFVGGTDDIRLCVNVSNGKGSSLYEDEDAKDVLGRLPDGYMLGLTVLGDEASTETYGILAVGMSASRQGGNISQTSLLKLEDADAAGEYVTMLEEEGIAEEYDIVEDGQYLAISSTSELPGPEELAYHDVYDDLESAVIAYYYDHDSTFPTINGTVNISGYDFQILDICALISTAEGGLNDVPEGIASIEGEDNDNCDSGCAGCSADNHYIWAINDYGIFSVCVGDDCDVNGEDGFQGVWP